MWHLAILAVLELELIYWKMNYMKSYLYTYSDKHSLVIVVNSLSCWHSIGHLITWSYTDTHYRRHTDLYRNNVNYDIRSGILFFMESVSQSCFAVVLNEFMSVIFILVLVLLVRFLKVIWLRLKKMSIGGLVKKINNLGVNYSYICYRRKL